MIELIDMYRVGVFEVGYWTIGAIMLSGVLKGIKANSSKHIVSVLIDGSVSCGALTILSNLLR